MVYYPGIFTMDNDLFILLTARKLSGEASAEDIKELDKFFDEDELFKKKFEFLKAHWENKSFVHADIDIALQKVLFRLNNNEIENEIPDTTDLAWKKPGVVKFILRFSKAAAGVIICLVSAYFFFKKDTNDSIYKIASTPTFQTQQTPKGKKSTLTLSDGTKVIMNADSRLQFPKEFSGTTREVYLTGEAFFDVAHNGKVPFIIHTNKISIKVLGTEFNVKSYPGDSTTETTLIHGLIEVTLNDRPDDRIILKPKEKLVVSNTASEKISTEIKTVPAAHSAELLISSLHYISKSDSAVVETSWMDNKLVFQDESFGKLAEDMERKYDVAIQFKNDAVKNYHFTGIFENETIREALDALQLTEKFNYKMDGITITIF